MNICDKCLRNRNINPKSFHTNYGECHICGAITTCRNIRSSVDEGESKQSLRGDEIMSTLKFIGTGAWNNPILGNNNAFFIKDNNIFLIDCGWSTFYRIITDFDEIFRKATNIYILITHIHDDHIGSLSSFIFHCFFVYGKKPTLITNKQTELISLLNLSMRNIRKYAKLKSTNKDGWAIFTSNDYIVKIKYVRTRHVDYLKSFGFLVFIEDNNGNKENFYYSGDSYMIPNFIIRNLIDGNLDMIYQDTTQMVYENQPHMFVGRIIELIPSSLRHKVTLMHLEKGFNVDMARDFGFNIAEIYNVN